MSDFVSPVLTGASPHLSRPSSLQAAFTPLGTFVQSKYGLLLLFHCFYFFNHLFSWF